MTREGSSSPVPSFGNSKVGKGLSLIVDGKLKYKETKIFSEIARIQTNLVGPVTLITILSGYRLSSVRASLRSMLSQYLTQNRYSLNAFIIITIISP